MVAGNRESGGCDHGTSGARGVIVLLGQDAVFRDGLQDALGDQFCVVDGPESRPSVPVRVIVTDLPPEGLKGLSATAEFRSRHPNAALVLLALYDHHYQESHSLLEHIADAVVLKPVDLGSLARTILFLADRAGPSSGPPSGLRGEEP